MIGAAVGIAKTVNTTVSAIADDRTYYKCPRCKREVYAYGSFAGNVCLDCPGTVLSGVGSTLGMVSGHPAPQIVLNSVASEATQIASGFGGVVANVATLQFSDGGNGTKADWCGKVIFSISKGASPSDSSSAYRSEKIQSIKTRSCGIFSALCDGTNIQHWWLNVDTDCGYYQVQFTKDESVIQVRKCGSFGDCDQNGLTEANRDENVAICTESGFSTSNISGRNLGDLISWLESGAMSSHYSLFNNNCKDLCKRIYEWI